MPIETRCTGCDKLLRVGDEHAGQRARCPQCGNIYTVPSAPLSDSTGADSGYPDPYAGKPQPTEFPAASGTGNEGGLGMQPLAQWYMQTPEGQVYGPVDRAKLDGWLQEGRITDDCQLREGVDGVWQRASLVYPALAAPASQYRGSTAATGGYYQGGSYSSAPAAGGFQPVRTGYQQPHRGGAILALGLVSLMVCGLIGIVAWSMGNEDLRAMRSGRMDPEGMGMTQAGHIMGIIGTIIGVLQAGFFFLAIFCAAMDGL